MNASLIGKALVFGPNEYRFESYAFKFMHLKSTVYLQNHLNFTYVQNARFNKLKFSNNLYLLINLFLEIGFLYKFLIIKNQMKQKVLKEILITMFFYKNTPFFKSCHLVSTPSKSFFISIKALRILKVNLEQSILILSTSKGIITHLKALQFGIGGLILYIIR